MHRLSSGLRINTAADDAAGLAISLSMGAKIKSLNQAGRNAADAISLTQTADQALAETTNNLVRMRELAVQAATGTLTTADRQALQAESDQLSANISQIAKSTRFNGRAILDGSNSTYVQLGADPGDGIDISLASAVAENLGPTGVVSVSGNLVDTSTLNNAAFNAPATALIINGQQISTADDGVSGGFGLGSSLAVANAINGAGIAGLSAAAGSSVVNLGSASAPTNGVVGAITTQVDLSVNNVAIVSVDWDSSAGAAAKSFGQGLAEKINATVAGINAVYSGGQLSLTANDGRSFEIGTAGSNAGLSSLSGFNMNDLTVKSKTVIASLTLTTEQPVQISQGFSAAAGQGRSLAARVYPFSLSSTGVLLTQQSARDYMDVIDVAMGQIAGIRSELGSLQNVLGHAAAVNRTLTDGLVASRSRILDADVASETAAMVRGQILQQAGIAILSQANQSARGVLSLLPGSR